MSVRRRLALLLIGAAAATQLLAGVKRTLTARDGRTMEAEILSYKGETLRVRRADSGQTFTLPLSGLSDDDQRDLREFMRQNPDLRETVPATSFRVEYGKGRADTAHSDGDYYDTKIENWGYIFTITNQGTTPIEGLRLDYQLYARRDPDRTGASSSGGNTALERKSGSLPLPVVPVHGKISVRTDTIACRTDKLDGNSYWVTEKGRTNRIRDKELHGVWYRVCDGDKVIQEASSPVSLVNTERWGGVAP